MDGTKGGDSSSDRRKTSTAIAELEVQPNGILTIRFKPQARLDEENIKKLIDGHIALAGGHKRPTLVDMRHVISDTRAARSLGAGPGPAAVTARLAMLVSSPVSRVVANFFVRVGRPAFPTRVFTDEILAERWLLEHSEQ